MGRLTLFHEHGTKASFHYAENSGSEWSLGDMHKREALRLFDKASQVEQKQMRLVAEREFIWSLELERPNEDWAIEISDIQELDNA